MELGEPEDGREEGETMGSPFFMGGIEVLFVVNTCDREPSAFQSMDS